MRSWVFNEARIAAHHVFRVSEIPLFVLFDEEAARMIENSGYWGPELLEIWRN